MKQKIVNEALENIHQRRTKNELAAQENLHRALEISEIKASYQQYATSVVEKAKCEAFGKKDDSNFEKYRENLQNLLKKHKIGAIFPQYDCKICNDSGIAGEEYCVCLKREVSSILLSQSGCGKLEEFASSNFDIFEDKQKAKKTYALMQKWCSTSTQKGTMLICGQTGTGKTHLAKCVASEFIKQGKITQMLSAFSLNQKFLAIHTSPEQEKSALLSELMDCDILIIDNLGTEPVYRNVTKDYLYLVINERQARSKRTLITTNLYPDDIMARYDERIFSRLMDKERAIVIEMGGKDLRLG